MTYRRRNRWHRRLVVGLAFASFVAPAAAQVDQNGAGAGAAGDPYLTDIFVRPGEAQAGPDGGAPVGAAAVTAAPVRQSAQPLDQGWTPSRNDAVALGLGVLALALAVGLAVGYAKRPRIAGI
jgi:hypothetical protein